LGLVGLLFGFLYLAYRTEREIRGLLLLTVSTFGIGLLGPAGTLYCLLLARIYKRSSLSFQQWYESLFPSQKISSSEEIYRQVNATASDIEQGDLPVPFIDIMSVGSSIQKQRVIGMIASDFKPDYARTLKAALHDEGNDIRVQAATAMASIENQFLEKTLQLNEALEADPDNPELPFELARHYDDYAFTGILDPARERENRGKALEKYRQYLERKPGSTAARSAIARILTRNGQYKETSKWIRRSFRKGTVTPSMVLWLAESEYRTGHWDRVRETIRSHRDLLEGEDLPDSVQECLALWLGETRKQEEAVPS